MTHFDDFASGVREGMHDATHDVHADRELTRRLIDTASNSTDRDGGPRPGLRSARFLSSWVLPAAAVVIVLVTVGAVSLVHNLVGGDSITSGQGIVLPGSSTPAQPTASPSRSTGTPRTSHAARSSAPRRHHPSSGPPGTSTRRGAAHGTTPPQPHTQTSATAPSSSPDDSASSSAPALPSTCSTPDTGEYKPTSQQDFENHLIGTWLVCSEPSIFGTDDAGLQIRSDGTWAKLTRDADGQLVAGTSSGQKGDWESVDDTAANGGHPTFQLNLHIDGSGTVIALAHISSGVDRVRLDNNGVYAASYVPTSEVVN